MTPSFKEVVVPGPSQGVELVQEEHAGLLLGELENLAHIAGSLSKVGGDEAVQLDHE